MAIPANPKNIVVLGAGISGLAAAHALLARGHRVTVLERKGAAGGRIHTEHAGGFLMEHGPNSLLAPAPEAEALISALALDGERIGAGSGVRHRYLVRDGRAHALPLQPLRFFTSDFFSLRGRLRLLAEPLIPPVAADETVAQFARRRFGREFLDYVMDPLTGGLYAGECERLSVSALFPRLKQLEREAGSVIGGLARLRLARGASGPFDPRRRKLFSLRRGLGALPEAIARGLGSRLQLGVQVHAVLPRAGGGFLVRAARGNEPLSISADGVVVALPAYAAARVLERISPEAAGTIAEIPHPPLAVVFLGYREPALAHPLDGLGLLAPRVEQRNVLGMLFSSTLFAGRAPEGHAALTAYVGGARQPWLANLPREEIVGLVHAEAQALLGAREEPVFARVRYWRYGLPQPDLAHTARLAALGAAEAEFPGLCITGNYVSGVSTAACIAAAETAAERLSAFAAPADCNPIAARLAV
ncbi:MAG: protoporphyrinogen oxidase [Betaproteobacteria bacterium]|nr:protoporphyrinogen oxidase [Betaproteobacteria bacterium]